MRRDAGFSLLELILAMTLAAMLSLTLYGSLNTAFKARRRAEAAVQPARMGSILADLIGRDFDSALPPTGILAGPFVGVHQLQAGAAADTVQFYSIGSDPDRLDQPLSEGIRRIELTVRTDISPPALVRRVTRNLLAPVEQQPQEQILCRPVRSFAVRYYDGYFWQQDWDSTQMNNTLPLAVELTVEVPTEDGADTQQIVRLIPLPCGTAVEGG